MTADNVVALLAWFQAADIAVWLDGGWGVDALVGRQTRPHSDLDLVVALDQAQPLQALLTARGFTVAEDHLPVRFVMAHPEIGRIDFHTVTFDAAGGGEQAQPGGGTFRYPPEGFVSGRVGDKAVPCISAEVQLLCHLGYEPSEKDVHDVQLLHREFGLRLPRAYRRPGSS